MSVAEQLDELLVRPPPPVSGTDLDEVRAALEEAADRAVQLVDGHEAEHVLPLRLPKSRVVALAECERLAVARHGTPTEGAPSVPVLRGLALDAFVLHELHEGPVADPREDLRSMLLAQDEPGLAQQVDAAGDDLDLAPLAAAARDWSGLDPAWWPRSQSAAALHLSGGRVRCDSRVDVELGGPLTGRPGVVVEVKVGRPHRNHLAEVGHYALLVALRDGIAPAVVARWYPGSVLAQLPVTADVIRSGARRLTAAIGAWAELQVGRRPRESAGPGCGWCPVADVCPTFEPPPDPFAEPTDAPVRPVPDAAP